MLLVQVHNMIWTFNQRFWNFDRYCTYSIFIMISLCLTNLIKPHYIIGKHRLTPRMFIIRVYSFWVAHIYKLLCLLASFDHFSDVCEEYTENKAKFWRTISDAKTSFFCNSNLKVQSWRPLPPKTCLQSHYITVTQFQYILTISIAWEFATN